MRRTTRGMTLALAAVLAGTSLAQEKVHTIKQIMAKLNKPGGIYPALTKALKAEQPDWPAIQQQAKTFVELAGELGKNAPPKGEQDSWTKLTREYSDSARSLAEAAEKKDLMEANAARSRLGGEACKTCHQAHMKK
jgi:cytochrome c556